jgi:CheY-like chemotaxis protein
MPVCALVDADWQTSGALWMADNSPVMNSGALPPRQRRQTPPPPFWSSLMFSRALQVISNRRRPPPLLLVEDEPSERFLIEEALLKAGHRVVAEARADRAADLLRNRDYPLGALITAVELHAGQSGWELAKLARQNRPAIPVIYLTRYSEGAWGVQGVRGSRLARKPSDASQIVALINGLLRQGCGGVAESAV